MPVCGELQAWRRDGSQQVTSLFDIVKRWINTVAFKRLHALPKYGHGWREEKDTTTDMLPFPLTSRYLNDDVHGPIAILIHLLAFQSLVISHGYIDQWNTNARHNVSPFVDCPSGKFQPPLAVHSC